MKILKIFGVVVAVHAAVFMFVFAIPGCRTTARSTPPAPVADTSSAPTTVTYPGSTGNGPVAAAPGDASPSLNGADINPGTAEGSPTVSFNSGAPSGGQHFNPTRPGTPVADVLQSGEVIGVTPASTYKVAANDSLWKVAKKHGIGVDDLAKANNLRPSSPLKVGQKLIIPGKPGAATAGGSSGAPSATRTYTVKSGESLGSIARKQGTTTAAIRALNPQMKSDTVRVGQDLTLPAATPSSTASTTSAPAAPVTAPAPVVAPSGSVEHIVKPGEGLSQIAKKYGVPMREIAALNNIANPTSLRAGQKIIIPGVKTPAPAPTTIPPLNLTPVEPVTPSENPVAPAPAVDSNPVSTPVSDASAPPVVKVEESAPVAPASK